MLFCLLSDPYILGCIAICASSMFGVFAAIYGTYRSEQQFKEVAQLKKEFQEELNRRLDLFR